MSRVLVSKASLENWTLVFEQKNMSDTVPKKIFKNKYGLREYNLHTHIYKKKKLIASEILDFRSIIFLLFGIRR